MIFLFFNAAEHKTFYNIINTGTTGKSIDIGFTLAFENSLNLFSVFLCLGTSKICPELRNGYS